MAQKRRDQNDVINEEREPDAPNTEPNTESASSDSKSSGDENGRIRNGQQDGATAARAHQAATARGCAPPLDGQCQKQDRRQQVRRVRLDLRGMADWIKRRGKDTDGQKKGDAS